MPARVERLGQVAYKPRQFKDEAARFRRPQAIAAKEGSDMPWNNQSGGGGWKGGNGGPWGQGPRNTGPTPPDLEELLRRSQDRLKRVLPGGGRNLSPVTLIAILAIAAAIIAYNFFTFR